jgi:hypothetical protein
LCLNEYCLHQTKSSDNSYHLVGIFIIFNDSWVLFFISIHLAVHGVVIDWRGLFNNVLFNRWLWLLGINWLLRFDKVNSLLLWLLLNNNWCLGQLLLFSFLTFKVELVKFEHPHELEMQSNEGNHDDNSKNSECSS